MKWVRQYLIVAAVAAPILLLLILVQISNSVTAAEGSQVTTSTTGVLDTEDRQARATAINAVEQWLSTSPSPLPTGEVVSWDGAQTVPDVAEPEQGRTREEMGWPDLEVHSLTLSTASGTLYRAEVTLELTAAGAVAASTPSLIPYTPTGDATTGISWPGAVTVQPADAVSQAATAWAEAFTSGDPAKLRLLVGDEDATHAYVPLSGVTLEDFSVTAAAVHPSADTVSDGANRLMVRAEGRLAWRGQPEDELDGRKVAYDLLVTGANTGSPRVVAWGGPGTGPTLEPFTNAAVGVEIVANGTGETDTEGQD